MIMQNQLKVTAVAATSCSFSFTFFGKTSDFISANPIFRSMPESCHDYLLFQQHRCSSRAHSLWRSFADLGVPHYLTLPHSLRRLFHRTVARLHKICTFKPLCLQLFNRSQACLDASVETMSIAIPRINFQNSMFPDLYWKKVAQKRSSSPVLYLLFIQFGSYHKEKNLLQAGQ